MLNALYGSMLAVNVMVLFLSFPLYDVGFYMYSSTALACAFAFAIGRSTKK